MRKALVSGVVRNVTDSNWDTGTNGKTAQLAAALFDFRCRGFAQPPMMISVARASGIAIGVNRSAMKNFSSFFDNESGSTRT